MTVEVHVLFPFRAVIGEGPIALDLPAGADVAAAVVALTARYPQLWDRFYDAAGRMRRHISALVNGTSIQFTQGFATPLSDGDAVTLLPPMGGG